MKKQIFLTAGLFVVFAWLETRAQPLIMTRYQPAGGQETTVTCGGNQYTLICHTATQNTALTVLGSRSADDIQIWHDAPGPTSYGCDEYGTIAIFVQRACRDASRLDVYTYAGDDKINVMSGLRNVTVNLNGGLGNDEIAGGPGDDNIKGQSGADIISGFDGDDIIDGGSGNDRILGGGGDDAIDGGSGNDRILGEGGDDAINGESGNDRIAGGVGNDNISGGVGNDDIFGTDSFYSRAGGADDDIIFGDNGNDCIEDINGINFIRGCAGNDDITIGLGEAEGGVDDDRLSVDYSGGCLADPGVFSPRETQLYGGDGNDRLSDGICRDLLIDGSGSDYTYAATPASEDQVDRVGGGGGGSDIFIVDPWDEAPIETGGSSPTVLFIESCGSQEYCDPYFYMPRVCSPP